MKVNARNISFAALAEKLPAILKELRGDPYTVVLCRADKNEEPEAAIVSPKYIQFLNIYYDVATKFLQSPEFVALREESGRLRTMVKALLRELERVMGKDAHVSGTCWSEVKGGSSGAQTVGLNTDNAWAAVNESIFEALQPKTDLLL